MTDIKKMFFLFSPIFIFLKNIIHNAYLLSVETFSSFNFAQQLLVLCHCVCLCMCEFVMLSIR